VHRLPTGAARVLLADDVEVRLADDQLDRRWERLLDVYAHAGRQGRALRHVVLDGADLDRITVAFRDPEAAP
jgi:hypothetical protein